MALVADALRQVLDQVAAADDVEELETAADGERRYVSRERPLQESQLPCVAVLLRRVGLLVPAGAVGGRVDVDAAREDHAVEDVQRLVHRLGARRHDKRSTACALDGLDVVERHEGGRELPGAPARGLGVRGDPDDRPLAHGGSVRIRRRPQSRCHRSRMRETPRGTTIDVKGGAR